MRESSFFLSLGRSAVATGGLLATLAFGGACSSSVGVESASEVSSAVSPAPAPSPSPVAVADLNAALGKLLTSSPEFSTAVASTVASNMTKATVVGVLGKQVTVAVPLSSLVSQSAWAIKIAAASGSKIKWGDLMDTGPTSLSKTTFTILTIDYDRYEDLVLQYEKVGQLAMCSADVLAAMHVNYDEMVDSAKCDILAVLVEVAAVVGAAAAWDTMVIGTAYMVGTWAWDHADNDGDGVLNKDDRYPNDPNQSFRFPPWAEGISTQFYAPVTTNGQTAWDMTQAIYGKLVKPGATSFDDGYARTVVSASPGTKVTFPTGTQLTLRFLQ